MDGDEYNLRRAGGLAERPEELFVKAFAQHQRLRRRTAARKDSEPFHSEVESSSQAEGNHHYPIGSRDTFWMAGFRNSITPVLTAVDGDAAVTFYKKAFGAKEIVRNTYPDGRLVAEMAVGDARFRVADETPESGNLSPQPLNGTTVRINLLIADPDGFVSEAAETGAAESAPVADQAYGLRQGRIADPFGHHWLIGRPLAGEAGGWVTHK
jgi:PhnB protein